MQEKKIEKVKEREGKRERGKGHRERATKLNQIISLVMVSKYSNSSIRI